MDDPKVREDLASRAGLVAHLQHTISWQNTGIGRHVPEVRELVADLEKWVKQHDPANYYGTYDPDDGMFAHKGFYLNEADLINNGKLIPLYR